MPNLYAKRKFTLSKVEGLYAIRGFSLIEILISIFFIITIVTILLTASGTLFTTRGGRLQAIASKIASKHIELLRNEPFTSIISGPDQNALGPPYGTCNPCTDFFDTDIATKLPSGQVSRTITDYDPDGPGPDPASVDIKQVTVKIEWDANRSGAIDVNDKPLIVDTLIYKNGL